MRSQRKEVALPLGLSIWGVGKLSRLALADTGARWACAGVGKCQIGEGKVVFPRRKVSVWPPGRPPGRPDSSLTGWAAGEERWNAGRGARKADAVLDGTSSLPQRGSLRTDQGEGCLSTVCLEERVPWDSRWFFLFH